MSFDGVAVAQSAVQSETITNTGDAPLIFTGATQVVGRDAGDFSLDSDACAKVTVAAGARCVVKVRFKPTRGGTRVAHLYFPSNACEQYVTLAGSNGTPTVQRARAAAACGSTTTTIENQVLAEHFIGLPACVSHRRIKIHLRPPHGTKFRKITVRLANRRFKVIRGKRISSIVNLTGLPRGRFTLRIRGTLSNGKSYRRVRHYVTCVSGREPKIT